LADADAAECQHWRQGHSCSTGMVVRGRSDTDELSLPAWTTPGHTGTSSQWNSSCSIWPRPPWSNFRVPVTTRDYTIIPTEYR